VDDYIRQRLAAGYAKASINRSTQLLHQAFMFSELPAPRIRHLSEKGNERRGFFTEQELRRVSSNLCAELADFILFAWLTGMRKGEIASLRWEDVDSQPISSTGRESQSASSASRGRERAVSPGWGR